MSQAATGLVKQLVQLYPRPAVLRRGSEVPEVGLVGHARCWPTSS